MAHFWLVITLSWVGSASLQYINTGGPNANVILDPLDPVLNSYQLPLPYSNYFNVAPSTDDLEKYQGQVNDFDIKQLFKNQDMSQLFLQPPRKRRTPDVQDKEVEPWVPNLIDTDKTAYLRSDEQLGMAPFIIQRIEGYSGTRENNASDINNFVHIDKRSFSPWGGKRDSSPFEQNNMWTWKRTANVREPSMPKRVRFSPWGGKRSSQLIYKPSGTKASKIIFSNSLPEVTRIISNYSPNGERFNLAGFQMIPSLDKRHPIRILALSSKLEDITRDALPFRAFIETAKIYKSGHPYVDINLKKDGKRKVKFSAWGGKRSPPIIGPIWSPAAQSMKDNTLDTMLLIRNTQGENDKTTKAF